MAWLFFLLILLAYVLVNRNYAQIKGSAGERDVQRRLNKLNPAAYKVLHDLYVPSNDGGTTQVDHIVTSRSGIFIIETKHYKGWIFGSENQKYWTQVIYKRKEKLYNPIWQNAGHIRALADFLQVDKRHFYNMIAFSGQSTFRFKEPFTRAVVVHFNRLLLAIYNHMSASPVFSQEQLEEINKRLEELVITERKVKREVSRQHIDSLKRKQGHNMVFMKNANCPKCGASLTERKGKYGSFLGCSNYPKCRFTSKKVKVV